MSKKIGNFKHGYSQKVSLLALAVCLISTITLPIFLQEIQGSKKINRTLDRIGISKSSKEHISNIIQSYLLADGVYAFYYCGGSQQSSFSGGSCPIVLNLTNKNKIEISSLEDGIYFDFNGDGFAEKISWALENDGILSADLNNNGKIDNSSELIKDDNIKFFDTNSDGIIDERDNTFKELRILKRDGKITKLCDENIKSINIKSKDTNIVDKNGNKKVKEGKFKNYNGKVSYWGEFYFTTDRADTKELEILKETPDITKLPDIKNKGIVRSLHQAMLRDQELQKLVEQFVKEKNADKRQVLLSQIIYRWTGVEDIKEDSRGQYINAKHLTVTEKFIGSELGVQYDVNTGKKISEPLNPNFYIAPTIETAYRDFENWVYAELMSQSHLYNLAKEIKYEEGRYDFTNVVNKLNKQVKLNPEKGKELIYEFSRMIKGLGLDKNSNFLDPKNDDCFYLKFTKHDRDLKWKIDTIGITPFDINGKKIDKVGLVFATQGADAYRTPAGKVGKIHSVRGNDVLYGAELSDTFVGCKGEDILDGGDGDDWLDGFHDNDLIFGGKGNDLIHGGEGNDIIYGGEGNDTIYPDYNEPGDEKCLGNDTIIGGKGDDIIYSDLGDDLFIFYLGDGQDIIYEKDGNDTLYFGKGISWNDLKFLKNNKDMIIEIKNTKDKITIKDWFVPQIKTNTHIENFEFADGSKYKEEDIKL